MRRTSLLAVIGVLGLATAPAFAQQASSPKSSWLKPTAPRAAGTGGGTGWAAPIAPLGVPPAGLVGGSDNCATPDVVVGAGPFAFDLTTATTGTQGQTEPSCNIYANTAILNDVWFTWTATFSGIARFSTCGTGGAIDTKMAVYGGVGCPTGAALGCNDDACPSFESSVDVNVTSGQAYTIQLGLYPNGGATPGTGQFTISPVLPPPEDSCATPVLISGTGTFPFDNTAATTGTQGQNEPLCNLFAGTGISRDVWYVWTSTFTGTARVDTCSTAPGIDTKIATYAGAGCPSSPALACNDDACPSFESTVVFPVVSGLQYTIQLGLYPGGNPPPTPGAGTFSIQQYVGLPNDECTGALPIMGPGPHGYDTTNATTGSTGQGNARCRIFNTTTIAFDLWYVWTASSTGWVAVNTCNGGQHDLRVAVYAGGGCPSAEPLSCDDDGCGTIGASARAAFFANAGQQYLIQVGSYPGQPGAPGFFTIDPFTPATGDDCASPVVVTGGGPFNFDCSYATTGFQGQAEALCANEMITYDLWYRWTATCSGTITVSACNQSSYDMKIAVYAGSACPTAAALACNDDGCGVGGGPSIVSFTATAGQNYVIQVGMWPGEVPGVGTFTITTPCPPPVGTAFCFGDGSGTACPCGNSGAAGNGCASSVNAAGANLAATGVASLSGDTVTLLGTGMPNSSALYFQGTTQQNAGAGAVFGDGKRCAGGSVVRLRTQFNAGGASQYPAAGNLPITVQGVVTAPGIRTYQVWYRNAATFCTAATFNLSNGVEITWAP